MAHLFEVCVEQVLWHETGGDLVNGGYNVTPGDRGGETKWGIAKTSHPHLNIAALTKAQAVAIYQTEYWDVMQCDRLPARLAALVFDAAVNQGTGAAGRLLQEVINTLRSPTPPLSVDGTVGAKTLAALNALALEQRQLVVAYAKRRAWRYLGNPDLPLFGRNWLARLLDMYDFAMHLDVS